MIKKFRRKPEIIEAIKFEREKMKEIKEFGKGKINNFVYPRCIDGIGTCDILTLSGKVTAKEGDYIIKGIKGEFYPCKAEIFEKIYEEV